MSARESFEERSAIREYDGGQSREEAERGALQDVINARARSVIFSADGSVRDKAQRRDVIEYSENADPEIFGNGVLRRAVYSLWKQQREAAA